MQFQRNALRERDRSRQQMQALSDLARSGLARYCEHMTETVKRDRLAYLESAVKGGADGAAIAFATAGPFGDPGALETRAGDPLVQEWKRQATHYLGQYARSGDLAAMMYLQSGDKLLDPAALPPLLAPAAGIAMARIVAQATGAQATPASEDDLPVAQGLSKEQWSAARALADDIVAAHARRGTSETITVRSGPEKTATAACCSR